jgi:hypothetical protein
LAVGAGGSGAGGGGAAGAEVFAGVLAAVDAGLLSEAGFVVLPSFSGSAAGGVFSASFSAGAAPPPEPIALPSSSIDSQSLSIASGGLCAAGETVPSQA